MIELERLWPSNGVSNDVLCEYREDKRAGSNVGKYCSFPHVCKARSVFQYHSSFPSASEHRFQALLECKYQAMKVTGK